MNPKAILFALFASASFSAAAQPAFTMSECAAMHNLATQVMRARQTNVPAYQLYQVTRRMGSSMYDPIIEEAYKAPIRSTEDAKRGAIAAFAAGIYDACVNQAR